MNQSTGARLRAIRAGVVRAGAVLLVVLAGPAAADECVELRLAPALEDAAEQALTTYIEESKQAGVDWWKEADYEALSGAAEAAFDRAEEAALAVRRTVIDEATAAMIDAVKVARNEVNVADRAMIAWFSATTNRPIEVAKSATAVRRAASRAYREAVRAACHSP